MIPFMDESKEEMKESEKCLDSQLWHACAGSMVEMPKVNSKVFYFPQGHLENVSGNVDFRNFPTFPPYVPCVVSATKFMADPETDEVFARISLFPVSQDEFGSDSNGAIKGNASENQENPSSFAKTLTQSDANNGGGFSVPRYCAETIFPRLDFSADPPVQTILAKDVHGQVWKFRHIYRGTPRRHLLTTGWSSFVNHKKLEAGDSIVFLRAENGDLCVGIRRAKRGIVGGWNPTAGSVLCGGLSTRIGNGSSISRGRVKAEAVIEAATLAASGKPFDAVYYPRASTPQFCVKASLVNAAMRTRWCSGMRFKMAFETEDSSRISWFMGTISSVQVADRARWPESPWRLLQVRWDEPDLLQNVKRVNPWLVELVSSMPPIHLSPFSPPHKKMKLPQYPEFALSNDPFGCLNDNAPAGMQGARHSAQYGLSSLSSLHLSKLHSSFFPISYRASNPAITSDPGSNDNISCHLTIGTTPAHDGLEESDNRKAAPFLLFGQPIFTEKQISLSCSSDTVSTVRTGNSSSDCNAEKIGNSSDGSGSTLYRNDGSGSESELGLGTGHCKAVLESEATWS